MACTRFATLSKSGEQWIQCLTDTKSNPDICVHVNVSTRNSFKTYFAVTQQRHIFKAKHVETNVELDHDWQSCKQPHTCMNWTNAGTCHVCICQKTNSECKIRCHSPVGPTHTQTPRRQTFLQHQWQSCKHHCTPKPWMTCDPAFSNCPFGKCQHLQSFSCNHNPVHISTCAANIIPNNSHGPAASHLQFAFNCYPHIYTTINNVRSDLICFAINIINNTRMLEALTLSLQT